VSERATTIAVAVAALAFCAALFWPRHGQPPASRPVSIAPGPSGLEAFYTWLRDTGVPARSLRRHYRRLSHMHLPPRGNLLVVTLPALWPADPAAEARLAHWVHRGNDVLVLAALDDAPGWARGRPDASTRRFVHRLTGAGLVRGPEAANAESATAWHARGSHPVLRGVHRVTPGNAALPARWVLEVPRGRAALHLLAGRGGRGGLWEMRAGNGRVWLSTAAGLLSNAALGRDDNARLAANLVRLSLGPRGVVVLDDMHQGLTRVYDPEHFYSDPRVHWTLGFMIGFWLLYVVGRSGRIGPPLEERREAGPADLALAAGGLYARTLRPGAAALERIRQLRRALEARLGGPLDGDRLWRRLAGSPGVSASDVRALHGLERAALRGARIDLVRVHNLCLRIDRELT